MRISTITNKETDSIIFKKESIDLYDAEIAVAKRLNLPSSTDLHLYFEDGCWIQEIEGYKISISTK